MSYPDLRRSKTGHWPARIEDVPVGIPVLGEAFGLARGTIVGWSARPQTSWSPADLLWTPPATKTLDLAGEIVDARTIGDRTWIVSQLKLRDRWLDVIRQRVLAGAYKLTPALAKLLGMSDDSALLEDTDPRQRAWRDLQGLLQRVA